ncbi:MAG: alcohol dehydrogenase catalytic domain-containing protein [Solirubrobacteraceae bacterium]
MRAYRLIGAGRAELVELPRPEPGRGEVLLRVLAAGVCRTDLALLRSGGDGLVLPVTLGHEIVGEVVALGEGVTGGAGPHHGAVVAVYELLGCGRCAWCARGHDNVCRELVPGAIGITRDGGMADHVVAPARNLVALGGVDPVQAAPLTDAGMTALHAVERARPLLEPGATAVVIGIGGLGHLAVQFLRATSKVRVLAVDVDRARLDFGAQIGADDGVLTGPDAADGIVAANAGRKVDVVFDFVGAQQSLDLAAAVTGRGGAIVVTGGGGGRLSITAQMGAGGAPDREIAIVHTFGGSRDDLLRALAIAEAGRVRTHVEVFELTAASRVLADLETGKVLGRAVLVA